MRKRSRRSGPSAGCGVSRVSRSTCECDQHFSVIERYKSHYENHMRRIANVTDFIAASHFAEHHPSNGARSAMWWLFVPYAARDIPRLRRLAVIPRNPLSLAPAFPAH